MNSHEQLPWIHHESYVKESQRLTPSSNGATVRHEKNMTAKHETLAYGSLLNEQLFLKQRKLFSTRIEFYIHIFE